MEKTCANHPEKAATYFCAKYSRHLCEDCMKCQDPNIYCKFRTMCLIWEFSKHGKPDQQQAS